MFLLPLQYRRHPVRHRAGKAPPVYELHIHHTLPGHHGNHLKAGKWAVCSLFFPPPFSISSLTSQTIRQSWFSSKLPVFLALRTSPASARTSSWSTRTTGSRTRSRRGRTWTACCWRTCCRHTWQRCLSGRARRMRWGFHWWFSLDNELTGSKTEES